MESGAASTGQDVNHTDELTAQENLLRGQILSLLRVLGEEWAPRTCEVAAATGCETFQAGKLLTLLEREKQVKAKERAGQVVWFIPASPVQVSR
jgi:hypothetical protein